MQALHRYLSGAKWTARDLPRRCAVTVRAARNGETWYAADGPRSVGDFAEWDESGRPMSPTPDGLAPHFRLPDAVAHSPLTFGRTFSSALFVPGSAVTAAAVDDDGAIRQFTTVSISFRPTVRDEMRPWLLCVGAHPAVHRALAGLVAWFALGRPAPTDGTYPDVCSGGGGGGGGRDPFEVIAAVASAIGNEGVDYCVRTALALLRPSLVMLPHPDALFLGIQCGETIVWLGGPRPDRRRCFVRRGYRVGDEHGGVITDPFALADALARR